MSTEHVDPRNIDLDARPLPDVMSSICQSQTDVLSAVQAAIPQITAATAAAANALVETGRIVYAGAGTSIRVAVQDGSELPPTFNWPFERLAFVIAGGERALIQSQEGAEDNIADGIAQMDALKLTASDVVIGVAASGTTPFTLAAIQHAEKKGAVTIGMANNAKAPLLEAASWPILLNTGAELIAGSTRMKAGTSQKVVLNMISTGIMLQLGRVYCGMMVDMRVSNKKLENRATDMVSRIAGCGAARAAELIKNTGGNVKLASLMAFGHGAAAAGDLLKKSNGNLRTALASAKMPEKA